MAVFQVWKLLPKITRKEKKIRLSTNTKMKAGGREASVAEDSLHMIFVNLFFCWSWWGGRCNKGVAAWVFIVRTALSEAILPRKWKLSPQSGSQGRTVQCSSYIWRIRPGNRAFHCTACASLLSWQLKIGCHAWASVKQGLLRRWIIFFCCDFFLYLTALKAGLIFSSKTYLKIQIFSCYTSWSSSINFL